MPERLVILIAEDDENYVLLIQKAFAEANFKHPAHIVSTGLEAVAYLKGEGKYTNRKEYPLPDLLMLDLNLPGFSGFEVIKWVRSQPELSHLRIIVLTSSDHIKDVNDAYRLGANSFIVKPYDFGDLVQFITSVRGFWLRMKKGPESFPPVKGQIEPRRQSPP